MSLCPNSFFLTKTFSTLPTVAWRLLIGFMSSGRGVVVHVSGCSQARERRKQKETPIELCWDEDIKGEFSVPVRIEVKRQRGVVATLATKINRLKGNIESINLTDIDAHTSRVDATLLVDNRVHLARIFKNIRNIKSVTSVSRVKDTQKKKRLLH